MFEFYGNDVIPDFNLLDLGLINGIRAAQSMAENGKTGDVLVFPKAPNFGPIAGCPGRAYYCYDLKGNKF